MARKERQNDARKIVKGTVSRTGERVDIDVSDLNREFAAERRRRWILVTIIVVLIAILVGLIIALGNVTQPVEGQVSEGKTGKMAWDLSLYSTGEENLLAPTSVAVGPNSSIYVAEPQRARVLVFDADGAFNRSIEPSATVESDATTPAEGATNPENGEEAQKTTRPLMLRPESVFVDSTGTLYVADSSRGAVFALDKNDEITDTYVLGEPARGVAATDKELYILGKGRVYVYTKGKTSKPVRWFGGLGNYPGEINAYQGIEIKDDTVYIADAFNHRVEAFSTQGQLLWTSPSGIASAEATSSPWALPQDLTVDAADHLVIVDALNFTLSQAAVKDGAFVDEWGGYGSSDGTFSYPSSIAYDADRDRFIVADTKNDRVQIVELPNSSKGLKNIVKKVATGPWRYIIIPVLGILIVALLIYVVYRIQKKKNEKAAEKNE